MPAIRPATVPVALMLAIVVLLLLHAPPLVRSPSTVVASEHREKVPVIAYGSGFTVTVACAMQPVVAAVYVIVAVPGAAPVIAPVADPAVATVVLPLLQVPAPSLSVVPDPEHIVSIPPMAGGNAFTVTMVLVLQPAPME